MKKIISFLGLICLVSLLYGQSTSVTNNNTIIIQGNVYYFQPSNTSSSPFPQVGKSDFISEGSWYGENAARAWASIADWVVERCKTSSMPINDGRANYRGARIYISQVHAYRIGSVSKIRMYWSNSSAGGYSPDYSLGSPDIGGIAIYYWVVRNGERIEDGERAYRYFVF